MRARSSSPRSIFLAVYAASGCAALVYEVAWTRMLTLYLGHTVAAASTVLAAFMGGLAAGAWIGGRLTESLTSASDPDRALLRLYARVEILVAAAAILVPAALAASTPVLAWAYGTGGAPARFAIVRTIVAVGIVCLPAAAMGATFPIAAAWWTRSPARLASRKHARDAAADVGVLYAVNTMGAAAGALAAGFGLIPLAGLRGTTAIAVTMNGLAAWGAILLSRFERSAEARSAAARPPRSKRSPTERSGREQLPARNASVGIGIAAAGISGFVALAYEVLWSRLVALVVGPTTYAFATVVAAFITGIALGAAIGARVIRRSPHTVVSLIAMVIVIGVSGPTTASFVATRLPLTIAAQTSDPLRSFASIISAQAASVALLILPTAAALGAAFTFAISAASTATERAGRDVARVYTVNTLGAIGGALAAGVWLLPALGLQRAFFAAAIAALGGAALLAAIAAACEIATRRAAALMLACSVAGASVLLMPAWNLDLLAGGAYKYARYMRTGDADADLRAGHLEYHKDGAAATVTVRSLAGMRSLAIDGKVDASNMGDMLTQRLLGILPVLLSQDPQDICVIGLGSGVTVGAALAAGPVRHADVIEISPEVVAASSFFERENGRALADSRVRLIVGDGRSHLRLSPARYDVIVSEPSNPWMAGVAALFTREFFEAARSRLKPDGVICQWAHTYDIGAGDLQSIVRTFHDAFPETTMWLVGDGDLLLVGTNGSSMEARVDRLASRIAGDGLPPALHAWGLPDSASARALFLLFAGGPAEVSRYASGADVQRDDRMALEFSAARAMYGPSSGDNTAAIRRIAASASRPAVVRAVLDGANDAVWAAAGTMQLGANAFETAAEYLHRAVAANSRNADALARLSEAAAGAHRQDEERRWLESIATAQPANAEVRIELARVLLAGGDLDNAMKRAEEASRLTPDDPRAAEQRAAVLVEAGDAAQLSGVADALVAKFPDRGMAQYYKAAALLLTDRVEDSIALARRIVTRDPENWRAQNLLGAACATAGRADCARSAFEASLRANPRESGTYINFGRFHLDRGDMAAAVEDFTTATILDPSSTRARRGLAEARSRGTR